VIRAGLGEADVWTRLTDALKAFVWCGARVLVVALISICIRPLRFRCFWQAIKAWVVNLEIKTPVTSVIYETCIVFDLILTVAILAIVFCAIEPIGTLD
jgi:hypothetical protein